MKYNKSNIRKKIMNAGLELFLTKGYEETTISEILALSGTSRSAFYNHFNGKEELLFSVAYLYDSDYDKWFEKCDDSMHTIDKLVAFNHFVAELLETSKYRELYPALYSLQVTTNATRHILNPDRKYYQILRDIIKKGQELGEVTTTSSYIELTNLITSFQIGMTYNWCLQGQQFSLIDHSTKLLNPFLESLRA